MNTVHERMRYFRETVKGLSLRELQARVNERLGEDEALSLGTISNYERPPADGARRAGPRIEFLIALKRAFPDLRLEWLMFGEGRPTELAERLAAPEGLEAGAAGGGFAARVLARHPDLELLSPEASALFMAALTRLAMGERDGELDEAHLLELAGDLRWLLLAPLAMWGFRHSPPYDAFSDYSVALLHALMRLMPRPGEGDPIDAYEGSLAPRLREDAPVGF